MSSLTLRNKRRSEYVRTTSVAKFLREPQRRPATKKLLENNTIDSMYAVEGGAALHFIDEVPEYAVRFTRNKNAYNVTFQDTKVLEEPYKLRELSE